MRKLCREKLTYSLVLREHKTEKEAVDFRK